MCQEVLVFNKLVEIITLNKHLIRECKECLQFSTCKKCQMPILTENLEQHQKDDFICRPVNVNAVRCPLCAQDLREPTTLLNHLTTRPGCPEGRKFKKLPPLVKKVVKEENT